MFTRKRRPKNLSPDSLHRLLRAYDQVKREDKPGAVRNLAAEFGIDRGSIARIAARVAERGTLQPKPKSGRKVIARDEDVEALREFARARNFDFTYREVEAELRESNGWTRGTAQRWFQRNCEELKIRRPADSKNKERSWKAVEEKLALRQAEKAAAKSSGTLTLLDRARHLWCFVNAQTTQLNAFISQNVLFRRLPQDPESSQKEGLSELQRRNRGPTPRRPSLPLRKQNVQIPRRALDPHRPRGSLPI